MTTLKDYLRDLIEEAVTLGQIDPVDLEDKKLDLLIDTFDEIETKLFGV